MSWSFVVVIWTRNRTVEFYGHGAKTLYPCVQLEIYAGGVGFINYAMLLNFSQELLASFGLWPPKAFSNLLLSVWGDYDKLCPDWYFLWAICNGKFTLTHDSVWGLVAIGMEQSISRAMIRTRNFNVFNWKHFWRRRSHKLCNAS